MLGRGPSVKWVLWKLCWFVPTGNWPVQLSKPTVESGVGRARDDLGTEIRETQGEFFFQHIPYRWEATFLLHLSGGSPKTWLMAWQEGCTEKRCPPDVEMLKAKLPKSL